MVWSDVPCKVWTGAKLRKGYGQRNVNGKTRQVHRLAWEEAYGPIPDGMFVCHHCDTPACYEVEHLFLGTNMDNVLDMLAKGRNHNQRKTHCPAGHPYDEANTYIDPKGYRACRTCRRTSGSKRSQKGRVKKRHPRRAA